MPRSLHARALFVRAVPSGTGTSRNESNSDYVPSVTSLPRHQFAQRHYKSIARNVQSGFSSRERPVFPVSPYRRARCVECRRFHEWDGNTFVERAEWVFKGHTVEIEKRWEISGDNTELSITEHVKGPKNATEHRYTFPVE
jgi:hypothetical protein